MTVRPAARANCTAATPTPPLAPWTRTHFPGHGPGPLEQGPVGGRVRHIHPGPLGKRDRGRQGVDPGFLAQGLVGVGAGQGAGGVDPVAHGHPLDPRPHGLHHAGGVVAGGVGQGRGGIGPGPHVGLIGVDADGVDLDQDLAGAHLGLRDFFQPQHFGLAEFVDTNGLHDLPLGKAGFWRQVGGGEEIVVTEDLEVKKPALGKRNSH